MDSFSNSSTTVLPQLQNNYADLLNKNVANYSNIIGAYGAGQQNLAGQLAGIYAGYGQLQNQIKGTMGLNGGGWGIAAPAAKAIEQQAAMTRGKTLQQQISSGLGNSTITGSLQNQNDLMANQAYASLGSQLADKYAGYQAQIGGQGLAAQMQGLGMQTNLYGQMGNTLGGYHFANTAGNLTGQTSSSQSSGGGGGGYGGGGGSSGSSGMLGWGGLGATATGWINQPTGGLGYQGQYQQPNYGGYGAPVGGAQGGDPLYDYTNGGNYGGAFMGGGIDFGGDWYGDSGGGGDF